MLEFLLYWTFDVGAILGWWRSLLSLYRRRHAHSWYRLVLIRPVVRATRPERQSLHRKRPIWWWMHAGTHGAVHHAWERWTCDVDIRLHTRHYWAAGRPGIFQGGLVPRGGLPPSLPDFRPQVVLPEFLELVEVDILGRCIIFGAHLRRHHVAILS